LLNNKLFLVEFCWCLPVELFLLELHQPFPNR
jgi:hypothetical protein